MENSGAALEERRDASMLPTQRTYQETREVTQMALEDQRSGEDEVEVGGLMAESASSPSDVGALIASQPANPKRPKKLMVARRDPDP
jgi:hypothetical protein